MMPLHFSDEEMTLLLELARPIEPAQRSAFLDAVAAAMRSRQAGRASSTRWTDGSSGNFGRRRRSHPTRRARAPRPRRLKGEAPKRNTTGDAAIYRSSSVLAFSHQRAWG
jgi:hypothetical protein